MEYIKKEELIIGEIYKSNKYNHIFKYQSINGNTNINIGCNYRHFSRDGATIGQGLNNITNATSEEKHWLNTCIEQDKFITFEEAMKTFIPEYVEILNNGCRINNNISSGKIYKCSKDITKSYHYGFFLDNKHKIGFHKDEFNKYLKPSTKEAYDAQFVVKEEFVLPEKWYVILNSENRETLNKWRKTDSELYNDCDYECIKYDKYGTSLNNINDYLQDYQEITFEQFKKYVLKEETVEKRIIEPLPQFKVIETIETITKVENNEGNQFFIGDVVKSLDSDQKGEITKFRYSADKSNIIAITTFQCNNGIGIDKIEHYIKSKINYEILEYKTESGISCNAPFLQDSHQFYINERCKIHSIKRISDDLIITVGDDVLSKTCGVPNRILSIELINNKIRLYPRNSFYNLEDILKINNK